MNVKSLGRIIINKDKTQKFAGYWVDIKYLCSEEGINVNYYKENERKITWKDYHK